MNKYANLVQYLKDFFYFTKFKLITFVLLFVILFSLLSEQNMTLGNITYFSLLIFVVALYIFLSIIWFAFKSKKHFLIGLILFTLLILSNWYYNSYDSRKREEAQVECLKQTNSTVITTEVMKCMSLKGYKKYR
ncbi:hypothetical protein A2738_00455 [Candidatus Nomurabacteria bacterium RIFCSPHIGHO2_01_FULL_42_15]|uniref:Uncharacterized protein n=1 Tax=Candidatus Nomurabacteria bacterium RIFCSPHIGHO2_01_FULL_42_15 TaxID=1801742 RepID=A0A1F6VDM7_9BACT|nr:MAG: hypothetical protein A2738_00455 [Candidatus Nomurabacteria bacterium RIFCSPHIGHO2_01_FULL_42_15]OGI92910.1 MAG: hypothetical protein A3A99_03360 [Candidatus Nomurabacteria bacterium RIFCSPLOWO2_01_FULL_41_18]